MSCRADRGLEWQDVEERRSDDSRGLGADEESRHPLATGAAAGRGAARGLFVVPPVAGTLSGKLSSVTENDQAAFLPDSAESTKSLELETQFAGAQDIPALDRLGAPGRADRRTTWPRSTRRSQRIDDGRGRRRAGVAAHPERGRPGGAGRRAAAGRQLRVRDAARASSRTSRRRQRSTGLPSYVTGPGGQFADFAAAFEGIDGKLLFTTVGVILVILLLIYRSPVFLPVLVSAGLALVLAQAVVYLLAKAGVLTVDGQSQGILSVLVLGASTDYALLLISRFKEELHREDCWTVAMRERAARGAFPPILASGATVDPRPALPAAVRPQQQQVARPGRRHRHRLRGPRDDSSSCPRC